MTVEVVSGADILRKAQQLVVDRGWNPLDVEGLCVYSAIGIAMLGKALAEQTRDDWKATSFVLDYFSDAIGGLPCIADWEMQKGRTPADVYEAFARAIHAASWNETGSPEAA